MFLKFFEFRQAAPIPPRLLTRTWVYVSGFGNPARAIISIWLVVCNQDPTTKQGSKQDPTARGIPQWESHLSTHVWVCPGRANHVFSFFADKSVLRNQGNLSCRQVSNAFECFCARCCNLVQMSVIFHVWPRCSSVASSSSAVKLRVGSRAGSSFKESSK